MVGINKIYRSTSCQIPDGVGFFCNVHLSIGPAIILGNISSISSMLCYVVM